MITCHVNILFLSKSNYTFQLKIIFHMKKNLKIDFKSHRSGYYEGLVRSIISQLQYCDDVDGAKRYFDTDLKGLPRMSTGRPSDFYQSVIGQGEQGRHLIIQHLNARGDAERTVAIISQLSSSNKFSSTGLS